ncbi:H2 finger protein [Seminavis robusta]|uniref:H2 finger protein n=1 Tax=Seminavis robusta TaxID=568900 RepID=A0A9N8EYK6_9STRA|nr:H2 finger protein [Seminavis robusta]|eukprot:Sro2198_g318730.1 H2 finger protein (353) ;mRNA; f:12583-13641
MERVARCDDNILSNWGHDRAGYLPHHHSHRIKSPRHVPANLRSRRQKHSLANSPKICSPHRKHYTSEDFNMHSPFLALPTLSNKANLKPAPRPSLSRKSSRKLLHRRSKSRDLSLPVLPLGGSNYKELKVYRNEAEFLIQNQQSFTNEDFEAVLAALAEESKIDQKLKEQEEESLTLAQELASGEFMEARPSTSESDDMEALAVAMRAEINENDAMRRQEEESFRFACHLVSQEAQAYGLLNNHHSSSSSSSPPSPSSSSSSSSLWSTGCFEEEEKKGTESMSELCSSCSTNGSELGAGQAPLLQCQACHLDIEDEETLRELPSCGHHFHAYCINRWFLMNKKDCPYCRQSV